MQQFQLHYQQPARLFPKAPLLLLPLAAAAAILLFSGHWMLLVTATCLGLALWHRVQRIERALAKPTPGTARLNPVDGGISSGQPSTVRPARRSAVVSDGGSFERAL